MQKKLPTFFLLFISIQYSLAQTNRIEITGHIIDIYSVAIPNTHIVNLNTKAGTISDSNGKFTLKVRKGDWLAISNITYNSKKFRITHTVIKHKKLFVYLKQIVNQLEEVRLEKKLKGDLNSDVLKPKKDTIKEMMNELKSSIMSIPHDEIMNMKIGASEIHLKKPKNSQLNTDPVAKSGGLPQASIGIPDRSSQRKKALQKRLHFKKNFPYQLKKMFGEHFFFQKLKIPKDKYFHFLEYCNPLGIESLFKKEKYIDVLKILLKESKSYLLLIENQE